MRILPLTRNAKVGYATAGACVVIAAALFIADWMVVGSGFAAFGILLAIDTAAAHGQLSKRNGDDKKTL
jgi:hypothetical protein